MISILSFLGHRCIDCLQRWQYFASAALFFFFSSHIAKAGTPWAPEIRDCVIEIDKPYKKPHLLIIDVETLFIGEYFEERISDDDMKSLDEACHRFITCQLPLRKVIFVSTDGEKELDTKLSSYPQTHRLVTNHDVLVYKFPHLNRTTTCLDTEWLMSFMEVWRFEGTPDSTLLVISPDIHLMNAARKFYNETENRTFAYCFKPGIYHNDAIGNWLEAGDFIEQADKPTMLVAIQDSSF